MLKDYVEVIFEGGHGGSGIISFGNKARSGPDGGNGGDGGDLYVRATSDITLLNQFSAKNEIEAPRGMPGGKNKRSGKSGEDLEIMLPVGTSIIDKKSGDVILELTQINQRELLCKGGLGGRGNFEFRSPRNTTPEYAQKGMSGAKLEAILSLKLIADFGLVGLPNAGKSSLLNELTNSKVKTGNFAFTTLSANIGKLGDKFIADIPGLIEGASVGRGLGIGFLKHIEKVSVILHCIASDSIDPQKDYKTIRDELGAFNSSLLKKPEIILLTKSDLVEKNSLPKFKNKKVLPISIHDFDSLEKLKKLLLAY
jgi:GTP-binding protein